MATDLPVASRKSPQDSPVQPHTAVILSKCRRAARCASRGPMDIRAAPPCLGSPLSGSSESSLCEATGLATTVAASRVGSVVGRHEAERMRLHEQLELLRDALARWGAVDAERERLQNRNGKSVPKLKQYPVTHRLSTRAIVWVPSDFQYVNPTLERLLSAQAISRRHARHWREVRVYMPQHSTNHAKGTNDANRVPQQSR